MAEYIKCRNCESPDCKGCNLKRLETMLENGKFDCMMDENRCINTSAYVEPVQEWISVNDPPTKQGWYYVAIKELKTGKYRVENDLYAIETAIAHGHPIGFCKEKAWPERDKVTHWCHCPHPPRGEWLWMIANDAVVIANET